MKIVLNKRIDKSYFHAKLEIDVTFEADSSEEMEKLLKLVKENLNLEVNT